MTEYVNLEERVRRGEEELWKETNSIRHTLYGNGDMGLMTRLALIEKDVSFIRDQEKMHIKQEIAKKRHDWSVILMVLGLLIQQISKSWPS